jgi:hypothetical protein
MARNTNTATVSFDLSKDGNTLTWDFNESAKERFGRGTGMRLNIGTAYFLATKDDRDMLVGFFGKGVVRRGLLVLAKGRNTSEADAKKATALAGSLRSISDAIAA